MLTYPWLTAVLTFSYSCCLFASGSFFFRQGGKQIFINLFTDVDKTVGKMEWRQHAERENILMDSVWKKYLRWMMGCFLHYANLLLKKYNGKTKMFMGTVLSTSKQDPPLRRLMGVTENTGRDMDGSSHHVTHSSSPTDVTITSWVQCISGVYRLPCMRNTPLWISWDTETPSSFRAPYHTPPPTLTWEAPLPPLRAKREFLVRGRHCIVDEPPQSVTNRSPLFVATREGLVESTDVVLL